MTPDEVVDRLEIHDLMLRYCAAIDRRDWDLYRSVFTDDADFDLSDFGVDVRDLESTVTFTSDSLSQLAGTQHNITNHYVELNGDTARACSYFIAYHAMLDAGGESVFVLGGYYADELRRTPEGWRISARQERGLWADDTLVKRVFRPPWYGTMNHHVPPFFS